jgi:hypothetical protein
VIDGEAGNHRAVVAEGYVKLHEGSGMKKIIEDIEFKESWERKMGESSSRLDWASMLIELNPERLFSYG